MVLFTENLCSGGLNISGLVSTTICFYFDIALFTIYKAVPCLSTKPLLTHGGDITLPHLPSRLSCTG